MRAKAHPANGWAAIFGVVCCRIKGPGVNRSRQDGYIGVPSGKLFGKELVATDNMVAKTGQAAGKMTATVHPDGIINIKNARPLGERLPGHKGAQQFPLKK